MIIINFVLLTLHNELQNQLGEKGYLNNSSNCKKKSERNKKPINA